MPALSAPPPPRTPSQSPHLPTRATATSQRRLNKNFNREGYAPATRSGCWYRWGRTFQRLVATVAGLLECDSRMRARHCLTGRFGTAGNPSPLAAAFCLPPHPSRTESECRTVSSHKRPARHRRALGEQRVSAMLSGLHVARRTKASKQRIMA